ncbi:MAG: NB-ARC domain-containing protein, partial [Cyanobacteria bacterium J06636_27]
MKSQEKVNYCWNHWIEGQVLLIFDDVESYQNLKENLPPKNNKFKVVVTSRQRLGQLEQLKLKVLHPDKALELLKQIIGEDRVEQELETAKQVCEWLGYLPLGLELIGRYLTTHDNLSLAKVLLRLENKKLQAKPLLEPDVDEGDMTAQLGVGAAFELSWEKLSPKAQQLGCYLSLFKAELFNWAWVIDGGLFSNEDKEDEIEELEELRDGELRKFSLLDMSKENKEREPLFNFHPLISFYFASKLTKLGNREEFQAKFCQVMVKLNRSDDFNFQPTKQHIEELSVIIPHLITVATEMVDSLEDEDINAPFFGIGVFYLYSGLPVEAASWYERCWNLVKERFDENHFIYIDSLEVLACCGYGAQGKYP